MHQRHWQHLGPWGSPPAPSRIPSLSGGFQQPEVWEVLAKILGSLPFYGTRWGPIFVSKSPGPSSSCRWISTIRPTLGGWNKTTETYLLASYLWSTLFQGLNLRYVSLRGKWFSHHLNPKVLRVPENPREHLQETNKNWGCKNSKTRVVSQSDHFPMEIPLFIDSPIDIGFAVFSSWSTREYHEQRRQVTVVSCLLRWWVGTWCVEFTFVDLGFAGPYSMPWKHPITFRNIHH